MTTMIQKEFRAASGGRACINTYAEVDPEGNICAITATGGSLLAAGDKSGAMHHWVADTFNGQPRAVFEAHNGVVPSYVFQEPAPRLFGTSGAADPIKLDQRDRRFVALDLEQLEQRIMAASPRITNTFTMKFPENFESYKKTFHAAILRAIQADSQRTADAMLRSATLGANRVNPTTPYFGHKNFSDAPGPGTFWRDIERPHRFFAVIGKRECEGHTHIRMLRIDSARGGKFDFSFTDKEQWEKLFSATKIEDIRFSSGEESSTQNIPRPPREHVENFRETHPSFERFYESFLNSVDLVGKELPPAPGERYHSLISGSTYLVIDTRRKHNQEDHYVTMEREGDKHRTKFTYKNHASWLAVWRPVDDEGQPRSFVEVAPAFEAATEAMKNTGTAMHEAAEAALDLRESDAERHLRILYRELDKRVPNWREAGEGEPVLLDEVALALRAIRKLNRHMLDYQGFANAQSLATKELLAAAAKKDALLQEARLNVENAKRVTRDREREMFTAYCRLLIAAHGREYVKGAMAHFGQQTVSTFAREHMQQFMAATVEGRPLRAS